MKTEPNLHKSFLYSMALVALLAVGMAGYFWISYEYQKFDRQSRALRTEFIQHQKALIQNEVERVADFIQYQRRHTEAQLKSDIKSRVYEALALAHHLFDIYEDSFSRDQLAELLKAALRALKFNQGRGYYFVYDMAGRNILLPHSPDLEGKNLWDLKDSKGLYTIRRFIRLIEKKKEGFLRWHWYKPGNTRFMSEKIGFARYFSPMDWWIGTGEYLADVEADIQKEILHWVNQVRFGGDGYIFVYDYDAKILAHYKSENIGKNQWDATDPNGVKVLQELIRIARKKPEGGFFKYVAPIRPSTGGAAEKISYVRGIPEWEWVIGAGFYLEGIEPVIAKNRARLRHQIQDHLAHIGLLLVLLLLVILLVARVLSDRTLKSVDALCCFFKRSATDFRRIEPEALHFSEFKTLARAANQMVAGRNQAIEALQESEQRLSLALSATDQGLWDWDLASGRMIWDRRVLDLLEIENGELEANINTWFLVAHPEDHERVRRIMAAHLKGKALLYQAEYRVQSRSGRWKWILDQGKVIRRDENGRALRAVGTFVDITPRKQAEAEREKLAEQLNRSRKMEALGLLAGGVAHDLNNVLSGIVGYPDLLLAQLPAKSPMRKPILTIQDSGQKAAAIVQDLLTLARRGVSSREIVNFNTIIAEYLRSPEHARLMHYHPDVRVETDLAADLLNVKGAPVQLKKTTMNLVSNAAEAQPAGGRIAIATRNQYVDRPLKGYDTIEEGDYVVLTVADEGSGISAEDLKRIFEPFYTKKIMGRSGTGLGMAVVWGTVQDHGGYINVESTLDEGTVFELYFPVTRDPVAEKQAPVPREALMGQGQRILVVDDVKEQREIARNMLENLGYQVDTVPSGEAALRYLQEAKAELIVLDMIMDPGMDGLETYQRILALYPGQKAVIASGFAETDRVKAAQKLGAGPYLRKPYTLESLGLAIRSQLAPSKER